MSANTNNQQEQSSQKKAKQQQLSKQKYKKMSKKDISQPNFKKQNKITHYFGISSNSTSNELVLDPEEAKINQLKQELIRKDDQIEKMRAEKETFQNKYSILYMENKNYKNKAKQLLIHTLAQNAEMIRSARRRVDMKLGYFSKDMKFVEGEDFVELNKSIEEKKLECEKLEDQLKKAKNEDQKDRIKFAITFIKKEIMTKQNQLKVKQKETKIYRERLKTGFQQLNCYYQQQHWRPIHDSHNVEKYLPLMLIGKGGFGQVYKCYDLQQNCHVAIKINNINLKQNSFEATNFLKHVQRQVKTHKDLKHPNIAQIRQILQMSKRKIVFVMDYCTGPQLSLYLKQKGWIEEQDAKKIVYQIFCALNYLNQLNTKVIHYDLKPSNIIFDHGVVKILDFGLCKLMDSQDSRMELTSQGVGTYWYLPPQTFCHDTKNRQAATITPKVDVWSTGVIFYQLLYGVRPFGRGKSQQKIYNQDLITRQSVNLSKIFDDNPNKCRISKQAKSFITQCLQCNPQNRLSANQAYNHQYFKS